MDPQLCWNNLLDALRLNQRDNARELVESLREWLRKGGFPPTIVGDESLGAAWHRTIAIFVCELVLNDLDDVRQCP